MKLYNTETRQVEELIPLQQGEVKLYCCGPTVYNYAHIGNFRPYILWDVLRITLEHAGYKVKHVMNITDVGHLTSDADEGEDKMMIAANRVKGEIKTMQDVLDIARFYEEAFFKHLVLLKIKQPHIVARATEHIAEIIDFVQVLKTKGYAYEAGGNIYFDTAKFSDYGKMARLDIENLRHGARKTTRNVT
jgi:cysteinyl-tRNA synthetase